MSTPANPNDVELMMVGLSLLLTEAGIRSRDPEFKIAALAIAQRLQTRTDEMMHERKIQELLERQGDRGL